MFRWSFPYLLFILNFIISLFFQKFIDSNLKINLRRMANEINNSLFVNQENKWDSIDLEVLDEWMLAVPTQECQMLDFIPSSTVDSLLDLIFCFINAYCDNSDFIFPFLLIFLQHLLIMRHRILARPTPRGPNVNKEYFSGFMDKFDLFFRKDFMEIFIVCHFLSFTNLCTKTDL